MNNSGDRYLPKKLQIDQIQVSSWIVEFRAEFPIYPDEKAMNWIMQISEITHIFQIEKRLPTLPQHFV